MRNIKNNIYKIIVLLVFVSLVCLVASYSATGIISGCVDEGVDYFGEYTFDRELTLEDGTKLTYYESGDENYHYSHDEKGFILIRDEKGLYYAKNEGGRPVSSGVSYNASQSVIDALPKMTINDVDLASNPDLTVTYDVNDDIVVEPILNIQNATKQKNIANIVIFIMFADDVAINSTKINNVVSLINGKSNSLEDYFRLASDGIINIKSKFPTSNGDVYIYQDSHSRSYYAGNLSTVTRGSREANLLSNAVSSANSHMSFTDVNLDINYDGYIDGVSFLINGSSSSDWGTLLWPHSWNLASINSSYNITGKDKAKLNGISVGEYSFNFINSVNTGLLCHEFFHVLGAPDLYHYNYDFIPVGFWDIMQFDTSTPPMPLTYMRQKYLGIATSRIGEITHNGYYSLTPTVTTSEGYLAYKIATAKSDEYIMVEYRNNSVYSTYDTSLPASGLIVYRIRDVQGESDGNKNAKYQSTSYPDEVYVYRPRVQSTGKEKNDTARYSASRVDLEYSAMTPTNKYYSSVGKSLSENTSKYDYSTIYYINGENTGIIIEASAIDDDSMEFYVKINNDTVDNDYYSDKLSLDSVETISSGSFSGVEVGVSVGEFDTYNLQNIELELLDSQNNVMAKNDLNLGDFIREYNNSERIFKSYFEVSTRGNLPQSVFEIDTIDTAYVPSKVNMYVVDADGDRMLVGYRAVDNAIPWSAILATKTELAASISASSRATIGVKTDGTVVASGNSTDGLWAVDGYTNIIASASGLTHTLLLTKAQKVRCVGEDAFSETAVDNWSDIYLISAGYHTSYGVDINGNVYATGDNAYGQTNVSTWKNIISISAGVNHVAGLSSYGKLYLAGYYSGTYTKPNAKEVSCGATFTALLNKDGSVEIIGNLSGAEEVANWADIVQISAGENFLLGRKTDNSVVAVGINDCGQCNVSELKDIIDIAGGQYHSAFLREDGKILFAGGTNDGYGATSDMPNLIYKFGEYIEAQSVELSISREHLYLKEGNDIMLDNARCSVSVTPSNATYKKVSYYSSDTSVLTVSDNGAIKAKSIGTATVTAKINGSNIIDSIKVTVTEFIDVQSIGFVDTNIALVLGQKTNLSLIFNPFDATVYGSITYSSQDTSKVIVNEKGEVTATTNENNIGDVQVYAFLTQDGKTWQATCTIKVVSDVKEIEISKKPTKTVYLYGEPFDLSGGKIKITFRNDTQIEQSMDQNIVVNGYNPYFTDNEQTITLTYLDAQTTLTIKVNDYVTDIVNETEGQIIFSYGEDFAIGKVKLKKIFASGATVDNWQIQSGYEILNYNKNSVGTQEVTISFTDNGQTYRIFTTVTVLDEAIAIKSGLTDEQKTIAYNSQIDGNAYMILEMMSGAKKYINVSDCTIKNFNNKLFGYQDIVIEYYDEANQKTISSGEGNIRVNIEFLGEMKLFVISSTGDRMLFSDLKEQYVYFDIGNELPIEMEYSFANGEIISVTNDSSQDVYYQTVFDKSVVYQSGIAENTCRVSIYYKYNKISAGAQSNIETKSVYQDITVRGKNPTSSISISGKTEYQYNKEGINLDITLTAKDIYENSTSFKIREEYFIYDNNKVDIVQTCYYVFYNEKIAIDILIKDYYKEIVDIDPITVKYGDTLSVDVVAVKAKAGLTSVDKTEYSLSPYNTSSIGEQQVTVSLDGLKKTFTLIVEDWVKLVTEVNAPSATYKLKVSPVISAKYRYTMASGVTKTIDYNTTDFMASGPDVSAIGDSKIIIEHIITGTKFAYSVKVINYTTKIEVVDLVSECSIGGSLQFGISATMADGTTKRVGQEGLVISGYNPNKLGTQQVSVSYDGCQATFTVSVIDKIVLLELLAKPTKTSYGYGEALSFIGMKVRVTYGSGNKELCSDSTIKSMSSNYNSTNVGSQEVTLVYGGESIKFTVIVSQNNNEVFNIADKTGVNIKKDKIIISAPEDAVTFFGRLGMVSYLTAKIVRGNQTYTNGDTNITNICSNDILNIVNDNNEVIFTYSIYVLGDANGDGLFDDNDVNQMAYDFASGNENLNTSDYDGDGDFSLTDLINWARKSEENKLPPNSLAKTFITNIGSKKKEECENV